METKEIDSWLKSNHRPKDAVTVGVSKDSVVTHFFFWGNFQAAALASERNCTLSRLHRCIEVTQHQRIFEP